MGSQMCSPPSQSADDQIVSIGVPSGQLLTVYQALNVALSPSSGGVEGGEGACGRDAVYKTNPAPALSPALDCRGELDGVEQGSCVGGSRNDQCGCSEIL